MGDNMPAAEMAVDEPLVRRLLAAQFPASVGLPLRREANGWDNVVYRLGPALAVRLPRRQAGAELVLNEQRWLPVLAPALPLPVPIPVLAGHPGEGYPWPWSVVPWFPGDVAATTQPADPTATADALGRFVAALHRPAPPHAPVNTVRGCPLAQRHDAVEERLARVGPALAPAERHTLAAAWAAGLAAPAWHGSLRWLHGDLHPANLLVDERGRLAAVIDFGDLTAGDPATDLAVAWMLFDDEPARTRFLVAAGQPDEATITRARGWAVNLALAMAAASADNPTMATVARRTIANLTTGSEEPQVRKRLR
ncbi:MAG: aminoglycoside phosphotransferase family protein [Acidimicrobiia bacterium]|nr:aminoglycoside phosphotransferase family protein [Acidimicrobiia bacterium]MDH5289140.1 aminoglycoside phosphotransferase family protein [Acidimicrobiia bacterium]